MGTVGCGSDSYSPEVSETQAHLKSIAVLYGQYQGEHMGQPPSNEEDFKAYVNRLPPQILKSYTENAAALWISSRDNQAFVIRYGTLNNPPPPGDEAQDNQPILAHEESGVDGSRYVVYAGTMEVVELGPDDFADAVRR